MGGTLSWMLISGTDESGNIQISAHIDSTPHELHARRSQQAVSTTADGASITCVQARLDKEQGYC